MGDLVAISCPGGVAGAGEQSGYVAPLSPSARCGGYQLGRRSAGDGYGDFLPRFNAAYEVRRVLTQFAESHGIHPAIVALVLLLEGSGAAGGWNSVRAVRIMMLSAEWLSWPSGLSRLPAVTMRTRGIVSSGMTAAAGAVAAVRIPHRAPILRRPGV
jgi:hypothetical protein